MQLRSDSLHRPIHNLSIIACWSNGEEHADTICSHGSNHQRSEARAGGGLFQATDARGAGHRQENKLGEELAGSFRLTFLASS